jgi:hypothetical protein
VRRPLADGDHWYEYPRYMFTNESRDILGLCGAALDHLGVSWRFSRRNTISVARRDAVARLDQFVGPDPRERCRRLRQPSSYLARRPAPAKPALR